MKTKYYKDSNGRLYTFYKDGLVEITESEFLAIANPPKTAEQILQEKIGTFTGYVDETIMAEITAYNEANYTVFTSPEGIEKYNKVGASHYAFASSMSEWIISDDPLVGIWKKAREIQTQVLAGTLSEPTKEEFIAMLPKRAV